MSNLEQSIEELKNLKQSFKGKFQSKGVSTLDVEFRNFPNLIDQMGVSPSGTLLIEENGTFDVTEYANAEVNVNIAKPSGIKLITGNGSYDVKDYAWVDVNVPQGVPIEIANDNGMTNALTSNNIGKVYKFIGTSETYETNAIYIVNEVE